MWLYKPRHLLYQFKTAHPQHTVSQVQGPRLHTRNFATSPSEGGGKTKLQLARSFKEQAIPCVIMLFMAANCEQSVEAVTEDMPLQPILRLVGIDSLARRFHKESCA